MVEATQETTFTLHSTKMAQTLRITYRSVDWDKPNNKKQKKFLTPGFPAQLARNMPQKEHTLSDRGNPGVPQAPEVKNRSNKSNPTPQLVS